MGLPDSRSHQRIVLHPADLKAVAFVNDRRWYCGPVRTDNNKRGDILAIPTTLLVLGLLPPRTNHPLALPDSLLEARFIRAVYQLGWDDVVATLPVDDALK
jgi:hypothetical protein